MKTILKVLYLTVCAVLAFVFYIGIQNSFYQENFEKLVKSAVSTKNDEELGKVFSGAYFDKTNLITGEDYLKDENYVLLQSAVSGYSYNEYEYKTNDNGEMELVKDGDSPVYKTQYKFDNIYSLCVVNPKFDLNDIVEDKVSTNQASVKFIGQNGNEYNYLFSQFELESQSLNKDSYIMYPKNEKEALLHEQRQMTRIALNFNVVAFSFPANLINYVEEDLGSDIVAFNITNNKSEDVFENDIQFAFDYSEKFFTDAKPLCDNHNIYIEENLAAGDDEDKQKAAAEKFEAFFYGENGFENKLVNDFGATARYGEDVYYPSSVTWQTIGVIALFILSCAIIYFLLFHFSTIKRIVFRTGAKTGKYSVNPGVSQNRKKNAIDVKPAKTKETDEDQV